MSIAAAATPNDTVPALQTEFLCHMTATLEPPQDLGPTPFGHRMIFLVTGGTIDGPRMKGTIVPNSGGDWGLVRADGSLALDVKVTFKTDDGALIYATYGGRIYMPPPGSLFEALDFAKADHPGNGDNIYFRTNPVFETSHKDYLWLNNTLAIGVGRVAAGAVHYRIYAVK